MGIRIILLCKQQYKYRHLPLRGYERFYANPNSARLVGGLQLKIIIKSTQNPWAPERGPPIKNLIHSKQLPMPCMGPCKTSFELEMGTLSDGPMSCIMYVRLSLLHSKWLCLPFFFFFVTWKQGRSLSL